MDDPIVRRVAGAHVGDFDRVDSVRHPQDCVAWMERQRAGGADLASGALGVGPTDAVLDIGCGPGADLAGFAATAQLAVGMDLSRTMIGTARERVDSASFVIGDGQQLPFAAKTFHVCWARAVLVHTPRPAVAVGEMARVLRPGGRAVLSEPDHGSHVVATDAAEIFERIVRHRRTRFRNPLVGRELSGLAIGAGLTVVGNWVTPIVYRSFEAARAAGGPFDRAVDDAVAGGAISRAEGDEYLSSLGARDRRGAFFFAALAVSVSAVVDAGS